ncbi:hypothetical protein CUB97_09190 [Prevotella intermedia]|uniref:Uncharacterized protein n=1 Tax=Prevotella intermedia TaxID=28131 RepID=A0A2M8MAY0_PREIN|nr:transposase [Prevotella intermedia]PJF01382.1 hypothetical protein CUB97_09190 [Prevotella intermedia]
MHRAYIELTSTEGALCWKDELEALRQRGVEQIDLVVSDALQGIENAVCAAFPGAAQPVLRGTRQATDTWQRVP